MINKILILTIGLFLFVISISISSAVNATVCCEKTISGLYCQDVPSEQCDSNSLQVPTACDSTSYCKAGTCYDSTEGTCSGNTPRLVCENSGGSWSEESPAQCELGCCTLGDQAAFVSLVRCKRLSSFLGLQINYNKAIKSEVQCVLSVQNQDKGACVFESDFETTCRMTTRSECNSINSTGSTSIQFYKGKLCTSPEFGTNCALTRKTICVPGKDEVYFVDSCGNPANIYDASKVDDKDYWSNIKDKSESCNSASGNANSAACGNCNYPLGTICRQADETNPNYGDYICADLNCKDTQNGKSYKHGESWCIYNDEGTQSKGDNAVGSRFYKHICINGEEVLEQCADFRQEECIEDSIETSVGPFAQAACRVNRWQDCTAQSDKLDCENSDRRDCYWKQGREYALQNNASVTGVCLPKNTPGLKFWEGEEAKSICSIGSSSCVVVFEKGLFGEEECVKNCECLDGNWEKQRIEICKALGDCGPKINWVGETGYKKGFDVTIGKVRK